MDLLSDIEAFCTKHKLTDRQFGELALNDKNFIPDIRGSRSPTLLTVEKVYSFMAGYKPERAT